MPEKQRQSEEMSRKDTHLPDRSPRICRAYSDCDRDCPRRTSPFVSRVAPRPPGSLAGSAHSAIAGAPSLSERDCDGFAVCPFHGLCRGSGLATGTSLDGVKPSALAAQSHSFAAAQPSQFAEKSSCRLRLVPHALELRGAGSATGTAARHSRIGGNRATLPPRTGLGVEASQTDSERQRPGTGVETGPYPWCLRAVGPAGSLAICRRTRPSFTTESWCAMDASGDPSGGHDTRQE